MSLCGMCEMQIHHAGRKTNAGMGDPCTCKCTSWPRSERPGSRRRVEKRPRSYEDLGGGGAEIAELNRSVMEMREDLVQAGWCARTSGSASFGDSSRWPQG